MGLQMNDDELVLQQQKKLNVSFIKDKDVWKDIYSMVLAYRKQFDKLFDDVNKKT